MIKLIQSGCLPSLHVILLSIQILKRTMSSYSTLLYYNLVDNDDDDRSREGSPVLDDDLQGKTDESPSYIIV